MSRPDESPPPVHSADAYEHFWATTDPDGPSPSSVDTPTDPDDPYAAFRAAAGE